MDTVRFYLDMLPRLRAEESMQEATRVAMGSATLKPEDRREVMHDWQDSARDQNAPVAPPKPKPIYFGGAVAVVMEPPRQRPKEPVETHGE